MRNICDILTENIFDSIEQNIYRMMDEDAITEIYGTIIRRESFAIMIHSFYKSVKLV